jgi:tRNA-splicing endonuclease subunit sen54 N-term
VGQREEVIFVFGDAFVQYCLSFLSRCMRSIAEWIDEMGKAKVTSKKGKHWCNFGFEKDKSLWLNPEEALYLVETVSMPFLFI